MSERVRFANQLRAVAALSVALSHLLGVYWVLPAVVSAATFSPEQAGQPPGALAITTYPWLNFGPLGVGVFFLISGFVIPFSLAKTGRLGFAGARLLRIYPTYVVALLLQLAVLYAASRAWGRPFGPTLHEIWTNALLVYDLLGDPSVDLVNWTLSVELKFYLLAILLAPAIARGQVRALLGVAAAIVAFDAAMAHGWIGSIAAPPSTPSYTASSQSVCLVFMLIGVAFNIHLRGLLSTPALAGTVAALGLMFVAAWRLSVWGPQYPVVTVNYLYALCLFAGLYAVRRFVPANPVLDAVAAVSFPFYIIHSLMGYTLLRALMVGQGLGYGPALALTLPLLFLSAALLHVAVERPTIRAGHVVGRWLAARRMSGRPEREAKV